MDITKEKQQRKEFCDILFELAKSEELSNNSHERSQMYIRLETLYKPLDGEPFRHFYSDIFSVLSTIYSSTELGSIDLLGQNLELIRSGYKAINKTPNGDIIDISTSLRKMYDHINLEIARISFQEKGDINTSGEAAIKELKRKVNAAQMDLDASKSELNSEIENVKEKLDNSQKEYITIMRILP